ncbi:heavy-metal-associated domain-containing protein [Companilactobacillus baiquanensis]|uniref:Cation transporter n=1 Tax=Companilactobacillus baiquanensis TaxID=2486005 RepID=A0ABW1URK5_9LACO|nr:heavy-metal-associated domain-containing protein [Companilactobacillus baiquanensis]
MSKKILISGLHCEKCPVHIAEMIKDIPGVEKQEKDMDKMTLTLTGNMDLTKIQEALSSKPFTVEEIA